MRNTYSWILVASFVNYALSEAPYPPSGWRPKGLAFELPSRVQSKPQTQQGDSYLPPPQASADTQESRNEDQASTPSGGYGGPDASRFITVQGLPHQEAANFIQVGEESPVQVQKSISQSREYTDFNAELNLLQRQTKKQQETPQDDRQFQDGQTQKQLQQTQTQQKQSQPKQQQQSSRQKLQQQTFSQKQVFPQNTQQQVFLQNLEQNLVAQNLEQNLVPQNAQQKQIFPQNVQQPQEFEQNSEEQSLENYQQNQQYINLPAQQRLQQQQYVQQQLALQQYQQLYQQPEQQYQTLPQQQDLDTQEQVDVDQFDDQRLQDQQLNSFGQKLQSRQPAEYGAPPASYDPNNGAAPVNPSTATPEESEPTTRTSVNEGPNIAVSTAVADGRNRRFSARLRNRNTAPLFTVNRNGDLIRIY